MTLPLIMQPEITSGVHPRMVNSISQAPGQQPNKSIPYLFTFKLLRISVASFFLGVSTAVTVVEGPGEDAEISGVSWGLELEEEMCACWGARGLLHWSQYTRTCSSITNNMTIDLCVSFRLQRNGNSPYLRFDIYEYLPPSCVGFVEFQERKDDTGELRVFQSHSVDINTVVLHAGLSDGIPTCLVSQHTCP